MVCDGLAAMI